MKQGPKLPALPGMTLSSQLLVWYLVLTVWKSYGAMEKALAASGRNILYAICNWGQDSPWIWGPSVGNSWRITGDITDNFNSENSVCPV